MPTAISGRAPSPARIIVLRAKRTLMRRTGMEIVSTDVAFVNREEVAKLIEATCLSVVSTV